MVFVGAVSAFIFVVVPLLLELWAIHLSRQSHGFARWLKYILPGLFLIGVLIALGSGAVAAEAVWRNIPSDRATIVASGISVAMNCGAFCFLVTDLLALTVLTAISFLAPRSWL